MRVVVIAAALALGFPAAAQTPPPAAGTQTQLQPAPNTPPPSDAPRINACSLDRDCPGALYCVSGQCVAQQAGGTGTQTNQQANQVSVTPVNPAQKPTQFGIGIDAGIPDGVALGFLYRPVNFLRLGVAAAYNGIGFGGRAGISIAPFDFAVTPTLSVEVGHFVGADATPIVAPALEQAGIAIPAEAIPLLQEVSYDFGNAHLGLEIGSPRHFTFFLRAGASYIQSTLNNFGQVVQTATGDPTLELEDLKVRLVAPSLKLGLAAYF